MKTLLELLTLQEDEALSFEQLQTILSGRVSNLRVKLSDIESMGRYEMTDIIPKGYNASVCLLTATLDHSVRRHWVTILKHRNGSYSCYDPLALSRHTLSGYMNDSGYWARFLTKNRVEPNTHRHQKSKKNIKTCGLHACSRLIAHGTQDLSNGQYHHWLTSVRMSSDQLVTLLCFVGHVSI